MDIKTLLSKIEGIAEFEGPCHDCKELTTVVIEKFSNEACKITGGAVYILEEEGDLEEAIKYVKCQSCYNKNNVLSNYSPCEVYSRVVGYLRPVKQWNNAKQAEFGDRKTYERAI